MIFYYLIIVLVIDSWQLFPVLLLLLIPIEPCYWFIVCYDSVCVLLVTDDPDTLKLLLLWEAELLKKLTNVMIESPEMTKQLLPKLFYYIDPEAQ